MGAVNNLNIFREVNLTDALNKLKDKGYWVYSSALSDVSQNYDEIKYDEKTVLVIGNESDGISKRILEQSDFIVKIPMFGNVQSLNVSVATGILLAKIREN
jgi:23S rRNA (guanosine2251-2'-O)-methyltransferase